ncbi:MAG: hypothetical protein ACPH9O_08670, partial [Akkermansiaceae bacterium]
QLTVIAVVGKHAIELYYFFKAALTQCLGLRTIVGIEHETDNGPEMGLAELVAPQPGLFPGLLGNKACCAGCEQCA